VLQTRYDALDKGSAVPLSLYDDTVRITKLARVGQADLYDAIRAVSFAARAVRLHTCVDLVRKPAKPYTLRCVLMLVLGKLARAAQLVNATLLGRVQLL
jgi:hypothetical protein